MLSAMREIIFDTETTGLDPQAGDRIIEIGAVELENRFPTGRSFHVRINPAGREIHPEAQRVHGISAADLAGKPVFADVAADFLEFVSDANLIAHNASFDIGFINAELARLRQETIALDRVIDTLALARRKHPMGPNSLDALCSRYGIDNSHRTRHGALLDAELLAEVYIEMNGGRQATLWLDADAGDAGGRPAGQPDFDGAPLAVARVSGWISRLSEGDIVRHRQFVTRLGANAVWLRYVQ